MYVMWDMHDHTTPEQARINCERRASTQVEAPAALHDAGDDNHVVESGGVVHDPSSPQPRTSSSRECSHGGNDRCICSLDEPRE